MQRFLQFLIAITFIGCSSDKNEIIGTWQTFDTYEEYTGEEITARFIFKENNEFIYPDDEFNETDLTGSWTLKNSTILIDYHEGTETKFQIQELTDSVLILIEDSETLYQQPFKFKKIADDQPLKDTLEINELPTFDVTNADTKQPLKSVEDSNSYFIWIKPTTLTDYKFNVKAIRNSTVKKTLVRGQYELLILKNEPYDSIEFAINFNFGEDSIFTWTNKSKTNELRLYQGDTIRVKINDVR